MIWDLRLARDEGNNERWVPLLAQALASVAALPQPHALRAAAPLLPQLQEALSAQVAHDAQALTHAAAAVMLIGCSALRGRRFSVTFKPRGGANCPNARNMDMDASDGGQRAADDWEQVHQRLSGVQAMLLVRWQHCKQVRTLLHLLTCATDTMHLW